MRQLLRTIAAASAGLIALLAATAAQAAPALWVVRSPTATLYLFGTMHILQPDAAWRTPALSDAYAKATTVWFETDIRQVADPKAVTDLLLRFGFDSGHPLSSKLDAEHLSALKAVLQHDGMPFDRVDTMRPWAAALALMALPMMQDGLDPKTGADVQLTASAGSDHKTIRTFETIDQQMHFFADMAPATEVEFLDDEIDSNTKTNHQTMGLETAWVAGDMDHLGPLMAGALKQRYPDLYESFIRRRNLAWVQVLSTELAGNGVELVNVGALHTVGDDGLPSLLAAKGFKVERLQ